MLQVCRAYTYMYAHLAAQEALELSLDECARILPAMAMAARAGTLPSCGERRGMGARGALSSASGRRPPSTRVVRARARRRTVREQEHKIIRSDPILAKR